MSFKQESQNLITRKIKYSLDSAEDRETIFVIQKQYNNALRFTYNRIKDGIKSTKDLTNLQSQLNNINLNSHFLNSAIFDAKAIFNRNVDSKVIFGGKKLFLERSQNKISKEEFKLKRLLPLTSIGESCKKANRLFQIIDCNQILFKSNKNTHIILNLEKTSKQLKVELNKLFVLQEKCKINISYKLDKDFIYLTFDVNAITDSIEVIQKKKDRILAIDQNPNYLGYSVIDWADEVNYKIIDKGVYSLKELNDAVNNLKTDSTDAKRKYCNNKRRFEIIKIAQKLVKLANHFGCEIFALENLNIKPNDLEKGRRLNKLVNNQWCRQVFYQQVKKYSNLYQIKFLEINPSYTSFIGNLVYRSENLPDMILSSIEISRRSFEFYHQYLLKDKLQEKNIILPKLELVKNAIEKSLEELGYNIQFKTLQELYSVMKKSKQKYRFLLEEVNPLRVFSKFYKKRKVKLYNFI